VACGARALRAERHASEQYFTSVQFFAQARRQLMGRPQATQGLWGSDSLLPLKPVAPAGAVEVGLPVRAMG
jgi:hypothetical protein